MPQRGWPDPVVGSRMIDLLLATHDGVTTVSGLLRTGRGLFLDMAPLGPVGGTDEMVDRVVARVVDSPVGTAVDEARTVRRVLVRPDGYVGRVGRGSEDRPDRALERWFSTGGKRGEGAGVSRARTSPGQLE